MLCNSLVNDALLCINGVVSELVGSLVLWNNTYWKSSAHSCKDWDVSFSDSADSMVLMTTWLMDNKSLFLTEAEVP